MNERVRELVQLIDHNGFYLGGRCLRCLFDDAFSTKPAEGVRLTEEQVRLRIDQYEVTAHSPSILNAFVDEIVHDAALSTEPASEKLREALIGLLGTIKHDLAWKEKQPYRALVYTRIKTAEEALAQPESGKEGT